MKNDIKKALANASAFIWWIGMDSNHRSHRQQIYSLPPLATREPIHLLLWYNIKKKHICQLFLYNFFLFIHFC